MRRVLSLALPLAFAAVTPLSVACSSSEDDAPPHQGTGGTSSGGALQNGGTSSGGTSSGGALQSGGTVGSGGDADTGGHTASGGTPEQYPCGAGGARSPRQMTIEEYCASRRNGCPPLGEEYCGTFLLQAARRGCGYVHFVYAGDVQDHWETVYDTRTGKLVYFWHNGNYSSYCTSPLFAGTIPECATWETTTCGGGEDAGATDAAAD